MSNAARKKLDEGLEASLAPVREEAPDAYREAIDLLWGFADKVAAAVNPKDGVKAEVKVVLGHQVNQGQEHRIAIRAPEIGVSDYLLRAFLPSEGYPVVLDLFSEGDRVCPNEDTLVAALIEASGHPAMRERLASIRNSLTDESLRGERKVVEISNEPAEKSAETPKRSAKRTPSKHGKH